MKVTREDVVRTVSKVKDMKIGQIGTLSYLGNTYTVLRTYQGLVALEKSQYTWEKDSTFAVHLLPPGTRITLESEV